jgi:hypothetical protein
MSDTFRFLKFAMRSRVAAWLLALTLTGFMKYGLMQPALAASISTASSKARIWYPEGHYPELSLPSGRHEAVRSLLNITKPMHFGDFIWNDYHIPEGPVWVRVDPPHQTLSVFRRGHEIGSAVILYGSGSNATPTGSFTILEKRPHYYSHSYHAPMPYMLRLTNDGVAIHGSSIRQGWATHGCIGVPLDFARLLFAAASKGDLVAILPSQPEAQKVRYLNSSD